MNRSHIVIGSRASIVAVLGALYTAIVAAGSALAAPPVIGEGFVPPTTLTELHLNVFDKDSTTVLHRRGADRYRSTFIYRGKDPSVSTTDYSGSTVIYGTGYPRALTDVAVLSNINNVSPDGYDQANADILGWAWPLIARQRSGISTLSEIVVGGRTVLRGALTEAANECAGLRPGVRTVDLDPETFVPVRIADKRRGSIVRTTTIKPRPAQATDFVRSRLIGPKRFWKGLFVRRGPIAAASVMPFVISMPASVPMGFELDYTGTARVSEQTGPEASFPRAAGLFSARWSRGLEPLEFTIRKSRNTLARDWDESNPFGVECGASDIQKTTVAGTHARYATSEFGLPNLWWRTGTTLYTLSGAFSSAQLVAIAESLTPVNPG